MLDSSVSAWALRVVGRQGAQIGSYHRQGVVGGKRNHLRDVYTLAGTAELLGQGIAAHEGDGEERRIHPDVARPGDQRRHGLVGTDHDHRLRISALQVQQGGLHGGRVARIEPDRHGLHGAPVQRQPHAAIAGAAKRVVLVQHRDAGHVQVLGQAGDHLLGLLVVGGAQVENVGPFGIAQELGAGERGDVGHPCLRGDRRRGTRGGRADRADQGEAFVSLSRQNKVCCSSGLPEYGSVITGSGGYRSSKNSATDHRLTRSNGRPSTCTTPSIFTSARCFGGSGSNGREAPDRCMLPRHDVSEVAKVGDRELATLHLGECET